MQTVVQLLYFWDATDSVLIASCELQLIIQCIITDVFIGIIAIMILMYYNYYYYYYYYYHYIVITIVTINTNFWN